jgi:FkbM family methyltransferase
MLNRLKSLIRKPKALNLSFQKTSYSQTGEDLIIDFIFTHIGIAKPTYIDIGAHHPYYLSNTAFFYEKGCRGINIEPDPELFKLFTKHRNEDINLNIGIGAEKGNADFYIISSPTLNTFSKQEAENYIKEGDYRITNTINIPINSLKNVIDEYCDGKFPHLLNVDAEGIDELIIKSIDYKKSYPLVICIETISFSTSGNGVKNTAISDFLLNNGYMLCADTYINTIFVREDAWKKQ